MSNKATNAATLIAAVSVGAVGAAAFAYWRLCGTKPSSKAAPPPAPAGGKGELLPVPVRGGGPGPDRRLPPAANRVDVIYGSNTGTAENFAKTLVSDGKRKGFAPKLVEGTAFATDVSSVLGDAPTIVFVVATYGEGEPTDDFREAFANLQEAVKSGSGRRESPPRVAVFGLGDRSYKYFCKIAVDLEAMLKALGCQQFHATVLGDARGELEAEFDDWREHLWMRLAADTGLLLTDAPLAAEYGLVLHPANIEDGGGGGSGTGILPDAKVYPSPASQSEPSKARPIVATIAVTRELLAPHPAPKRSTKHIELDISNHAAMAYQAGDHCGIYPCNPDELVTEYLDALRVPEADRERVVELTRMIETRARTLRAVNILPGRVTLRQCFKWYLNLAGPPKRSTLRVCAQYCTDADEKRRFVTMFSTSPTTPSAVARSSTSSSAAASAGGISTSFLASDPPHAPRIVLGYLKLFPSCAPDLGHFLEAMPLIVPRYFSIASDFLQHPKRIHLTVGIVDGGLCSGLLANAIAGDEVYMFVRKSTFHLPMQQKSRPVILIGPGTGVAPFIGFCQRREAWRQRAGGRGSLSSSASLSGSASLASPTASVIGRCYFLFGCRNEQVDFLYRSELEAWRASDVVTHLGIAFSRDQDAKVYVQDRLRDVGPEIVHAILRESAHVFVCGDATKMAKDVEATLLLLLEQHGGLSKAEAAKKMGQLETEHRYLKDVWAS